MVQCTCIWTTGKVIQKYCQGKLPKAWHTIITIIVGTNTVVRRSIFFSKRKWRQLFNATCRCIIFSNNIIIIIMKLGLHYSPILVINDILKLTKIIIVSSIIVWQKLKLLILFKTELIVSFQWDVCWTTHYKFFYITFLWI